MIIRAVITLITNHRRPTGTKNIKMNKNINVDLFRRFSASNKVEMVNALTKDELLSVTEQTITRIVKEVGFNYSKSRDKKMYIKSELRCGNNWNSEIDYLDYIKGKVYVNVYIQNEDTDTDKGELLSVFLKRGDFNTKAYFTNRYGDDIPTYVTYTPDDKAKVIKSILLHYLYTKYADKLKADK